MLEHGEQVLCRNPWDMGTQLDMAEAFDALGLLDLAVFTLDQARQKYPKDATLNRALARLFEKRGDFQKAIVLWQLVKEKHPTDVEAAHKAKDLAASETIQKGQYVEAATGTKDSPVLGRIESRAIEKQDHLSRDSEPLLQRIEADPTEPALYVQLASVFRRHDQLDRARAVLTQGLGPTGNAFQLQLELMDLDLAPVRKNLELAETRLRRAEGEEAQGRGGNGQRQWGRRGAAASATFSKCGRSWSRRSTHARSTSSASRPTASRRSSATASNLARAYSRPTWSTRPSPSSSRPNATRS